MLTWHEGEYECSKFNEMHELGQFRGQPFISRLTYILPLYEPLNNCYKFVQLGCHAQIGIEVIGDIYVYMFIYIAHELTKSENYKPFSFIYLLV